MKYYLPICFLFVVFHSFGQRLHDPAEIVRLMEESELTYVFDTLEREVPSPIYKNIGQKSENLIRIATATEIRLEEKEIKNWDKRISKKLKKADKELGKQRGDKARKHLEKALIIEPSNSDLLNKMGRSYLLEKDYSSALYWFDKTLEFNSIDSDALLYSAMCHMGLSEKEKALDKITLAHIFNRNNPFILDTLIRMYEKNGKKYSTISFQPIFEVTQNKGNKNINIDFGHSVWAAYGAVKSLWIYEPGYREKMSKISIQDPEIIQEKEAVMNALITYEGLESEDKKEQFPLFELLSKISTKRQIDSFILYEIVSKKDPLILLLLTDKKLESLKNYILTYRSEIQ